MTDTDLDAVPVEEPTPELLALLRVAEAQIAAGQVRPRSERER